MMQRHLVGASDEQADALLVEQTKLLYAGLPSAILINTLLALILVSMQSAVIAPTRLLVWLAMFGIILLARAALAVAWRLRGQDAANCAPCWLRRFRISVIATGMMWGMAAALLFPAGDVTYQVSLSFVLAGMSAGAITLLAVDRVSMLGFLVPTLVPLIVRFGVEDGAVPLAMGAMVALFLFFIASNATRVGRSLYENFVLRIKAEEQEQVLRQSEARLNQAQRSAHIGNWELDLDSNKLHWSDEIYRIFEVDRATFGASFEAFLTTIHPDDRDAVNRAYLDSLKNKSPYEIEHRLLFQDGRIKYVHERCESEFDQNGKALRSIGTVQDITGRKQMELELRQFKAIIESTDDAIFSKTLNGVIQSWNLGAEKMFGYMAKEAIGHPMAMLTPLDRLNEEDDILSRISRDERIDHFETVRCRKDGRLLDISITISPVIDNDGKVIGASNIARDITERKTSEEKIRNLAFFDALTQLPNRRLLNDRLVQAMAASKRSGRYGALMFLDLDNFKPLNDTYGHGVGDLLLIEVARRISCCVRETDTVTRFGGDEFVVILSELDLALSTSNSQAGIVAEKIRVTLAEPYALTIQPVGDAKVTVEHHCTSSIGVVMFINHEVSPEDILKWADMAMYQAKEGGRNQVRFYE